MWQLRRWFIRSWRQHSKPVAASWFYKKIPIKLEKFFALFTYIESA
jgi:hypothetical protein